ncbi:hypothetical protein THASP1DRAFT_24976 [Thamnocephalis sphaerospora]|uniref:MPN domain-containing protein n=1 Tax=Thamnocephalis sphaerospora TaxID=78915 RepID=A0A4P9XLL6_9FUNG|nr:hypothetical protein THASP1DRAFT_24976 [Thamnocephalis sphaerospora]|eukprot:RKP06763.1 hypothetical protein THASP1DRAFT_24976 [Thamnocephalis sphaerospora]
MSTAVYTVSRRAYAKIVLHAAAYTSSSVNGVLLASKSSVATNSVVVTDAVPLLHTRLTLSPMLEVAFEQLDIYCEKTGQTIIGYYQANELLTSRDLGTAGAKIATRVHSVEPTAFAVVVDNQKLATVEPENALVFHNIHDGQWRVAPNQPGARKQDSSSRRFELETEAPAVAAAAVGARLHRELVDFDAHLTTPSADWLRNDAVLAALAN